ncbi:MAG: PilN domain-containing protein [Solirubrobacteraceae bacterium]
MKAVNLIPPDARRGGSGQPGRSGSGVYLVLGVLGVCVVAMAAYVLSGNQVSERKSELTRLRTEVTAAQGQAAALKPYRDFATLSQTRVQTVSQLAASRFDWEGSLRQLARVLPANVWLTSLTGTVAPGVSLAATAGGSGSSGLRGALPVPALELVGCTESQSEVSRVLARLRRMRGVQRVSLAASEKVTALSSGGAPGGAPVGTPAGGAQGDCRNGNARFPQFELVVFFTAPAGAVAPPGARGAAPAPAAGTPPAQQPVTQTQPNPTTTAK